MGNKMFHESRMCWASFWTTSLRLRYVGKSGSGVYIVYGVGLQCLMSVVPSKTSFGRRFQTKENCWSRMAFGRLRIAELSSLPRFVSTILLVSAVMLVTQMVEKLLDTNNIGLPGHQRWWTSLAAFKVDQTCCFWAAFSTKPIWWQLTFTAQKMLVKTKSYNHQPTLKTVEQTFLFFGSIGHNIPYLINMFKIVLNRCIYLNIKMILTSPANYQQSTRIITLSGSQSARSCDSTSANTSWYAVGFTGTAIRKKHQKTKTKYGKTLQDWKHKWGIKNNVPIFSKKLLWLKLNK